MDHPFPLLALIPATNEADRQTLLHYVRTAPLAPDHWKVLKTIYKGYEATPDADITAAIIIRLDEAPVQGLQVTYPTAKTVGYMKRRARRFLKSLPDPALYFEIASRVLLAAKGKQEIDFTHQWITADLLLGNSRRAWQQGHGRGPVVFNGLQFHRTRPEDRRPAVWDAHLPFVRQLLSPDLPWVTQEFALKVLGRNGQPVPTFSEAQLTGFFAAPSLWLKRTACGQAYAAYRAGRTLSAPLWAGLFAYGNAAQRQELRQSGWAKQPDAWQLAVATHLRTYLLGLPPREGLSQRMTAVLTLLHSLGRHRFSPGQVLSMAAPLFRSGQQDLTEWAFAAAENADPSTALAWFNAAATDEQSGRLAGTFRGKYKRISLEATEIEPFVFHPSFVVCWFGWELVRHNSQNYEGAVRGIWSKLVKGIGKPKVETSLHNTIHSDAAAEVFTGFYTNYEYLLSDDRSFPGPAFAFVLEYGNEAFRRFLSAKLLEWFREKPLQWLPLLSQCPPAVRQDILRRTAATLGGRHLFSTQAFLFAIRNATPPHNGWLWETLLYLLDTCQLAREDVTILFACAAKEPGALGRLVSHLPLLKNAGRKAWFMEELRRQLAAQTELIAHADPATARLLLNAATPSQLAAFIPALGEESWKQLRPAFHACLAALPQPVLFWQEALRQVAESEKGDVLATRLFEAPLLRALFLGQPDPGILAVQHPAVEVWLGEWTQANLAALAQQPDAWYRACTHKLPAVRTPALAAALAQKPDLPFVLRLLESGLPPVQQAVQGHLEALPVGSNGEFDAVLALCDSPDRATRGLGIAFLQKRLPGWPGERRDRLLECLSEHSHPQVHHLVSEALLAQPLDQPFVQRFDQAILRMQNRSRQAKEHVKRRQEQNPSLPTEVLLEMA
ncbi:MAG: hypothetical protein ICV83_24080, partial [Cytophagales bacterium]|nr:hypothetical protein [Cytophagales bacterium]